jgi:4-hydroxy-2-oxoheptanedioate aldolase
MKSIRQRVRQGEMVCGTWVVLGSSLAAEITGNAGWDWVLLDMEHGMGGSDSLLVQLQAVESTPAAPLVRVSSNEAALIKRVLDLGPSGIMVPMVNSAADAERAVWAMRYPPQGGRGVSPYTRPAKFGQNFANYYATANENLLGVMQIETEQAVEHADEIAAVDGVDVLFIGPLDLSIGLGIMRHFDHPKYRDAVKKVVNAARQAGKAAGILILDVESVEETVARGFTFVGRASDGSTLATAMKELCEPFRQYRLRAQGSKG